MQEEFEKEYVRQLLAEIKHYLQPQEKDGKSKQFLLGMCFALDSILDSCPAYITHKKLIGAINYLAIETLPYYKKAK